MNVYVDLGKVGCSVFFQWFRYPAVTHLSFFVCVFRWLLLVYNDFLTFLPMLGLMFNFFLVGFMLCDSANLPVTTNRK